MTKLAHDFQAWKRGYEDCRAVMEGALRLAKAKRWAWFLTGAALASLLMLAVHGTGC